MLRVDNAEQLSNAVILGLRNPGMIDSQKTYSQIALIVLLRFEGRIKDKCHESDHVFILKCARIGFQRLRELSPVNIKVCGNHSFEAVREGRKHMENKPRELVVYAEQVDQILRHMAFTIIKEKKLSVTMVVYAIIFSVFEREFIDCPKFTSRSRTHLAHDAMKAESIAITMETFLTRKSEEILMNSDVEMEEMIASVMETVGKGDRKQNFAGMLSCRHIIDQVTEEVEVTLPYLYSIAKDRKSGVVHVPYVYFCRGKNANGEYGMCKPVMTRVAVRVRLPSLSRMANPLCIHRMQKYLAPWIKKVSMTAPAITEMVGIANDRKYWDTSASVEGTFGSGKNHRSNNGTTFASVEQLIDARWTESLGSERQL